jgi:hypothetical protein
MSFAHVCSEDGLQPPINFTLFARSIRNVAYVLTTSALLHLPGLFALHRHHITPLSALILIVRRAMTEDSGVRVNPADFSVLLPF